MGINLIKFYNKLCSYAISQPETHIKKELSPHKKQGNLYIFSDVLKKMQTVWTKVNTEVRGIAGRLNIKDFYKENTCRLLSSSLTKEAYYQLLAHLAAYESWSKGEELPGSVKAGIVAYTVQETIQDMFGFKAVVLVQKERKQPPIILFRGTVFSLGNISDDAHSEIGSIGFNRNKKKIKAILSSLYMKYGKVDVLGHSLGGAFAQLTTANYTDKIGHCISYNSPGVGARVAQIFHKKIQQAAEEVPHVIRVRHAKDLISLAGRDHIPVSKSIITGRLEDPISHIEAHSIPSLNDETPILSHEDELSAAYRYVQENIQRIHALLQPLALLFEKNADRIEFTLKNIGTFAWV